MDSAFPHGPDERRPDAGHWTMADTAAALSAAQAMQTSLRDGPIPDGTGSARELGLDAGPIGEVMVAFGGLAAGAPRDEGNFVHGPGTTRSRVDLFFCAKCLLIGTARCRAGTPGGVRGEEAQASPLSRLGCPAGRADYLVEVQRAHPAIARAKRC